MTSGTPASELPVPAPVMALADGGPVRSVWVNWTGGITFAIGADGPRRFVKWAPSGSGIDLGAEAARMRWAGRFTLVPRVLGEGSDGAGSWLMNLWRHTRTSAGWAVSEIKPAR